MARIAVGGFQHEANTFSQRTADLNDFLNGGNWPGMLQGEEIIAVTAAMNLPVTGAIRSLQRLGHEVVPLIWAAATPPGRVEHSAYNYIVACLFDALMRAGRVDGVYLDLHGAMATTLCDDGEGALLRMLKQIVGDALPVVASLDLHANVSPTMFALTDGLVGYRTYPHVDMEETGERAAILLDTMLRRGKRCAKSLCRLPFLVPLTGQSTFSEPSLRLYQCLEKIERDSGVDSLSWAGGFALADVADCGQAILAYAQTQQAADRAVDLMAEKVSAAENLFENSIWEEREAVTSAMAIANAAQGPVILADIQDNPGGGGSSDTTGLLRCLIGANAQNAVVAMIHDAPAALAACAAGAGRKIEVSLGGKGPGPGGSPGRPYHGCFSVERIGDGHCIGTGSLWKGKPIDLGVTALLRIGGVRVIVTSNKMQAADQAVLRHVGIEPRSVSILVLKSSVHFRADFQAIAGRILLVASPGLVSVRLGELSYRNLQPHTRFAGTAISGFA